MSKIHGLKVPNPSYIDNYFDWSSKKSLAMLNDFRAFFQNMITKYKPLTLIMVIFSDNNPAYKVVKTCGDLLYGITTQGVNAKNVFKCNEQTISNLVLKANTKLGGRNFILWRGNQLYIYNRLLYNFTKIYPPKLASFYDFHF